MGGIWYWQGTLEQKPIPVTFCPPQVLHASNQGLRSERPEPWHGLINAVTTWQRVISNYWPRKGLFPIVRVVHAAEIVMIMHWEFCIAETLGGKIVWKYNLRLVGYVGVDWLGLGRLRLSGKALMRTCSSCQERHSWGPVPVVRKGTYGVMCEVLWTEGVSY
jgi:hypothetical protein